MVKQKQESGFGPNVNTQRIARGIPDRVDDEIRPETMDVDIEFPSLGTCGHCCSHLEPKHIPATTGNAVRVKKSRKNRPKQEMHVKLKREGDHNGTLPVYLCHSHPLLL